MPAYGCAGGAIDWDAKMAFTVGRDNTMMVKTPSTVPIGAKAQLMAATTKQNL